MVSSVSARTSQPARTAPRSSPKPASRPPLRVAAAEPTTRTKERIWPALAIVTLLAIAIAFLVVVLFASNIQTQAEIDGIKREIEELRETRINVLAKRAWYDSPEGLAETATRAGLVPAPEVALLVPLAPGLLPPPNEIDPFTPPIAADR